MGYINRTMTNKGNVYDPTAHKAMNKVIHDEQVSQGRTRTIEVDQRHHEVTIVTTDGRGHITRISTVYENEEELQILIR